MVELRSALRGDEFNKDQFIDKMKIVDEMIIDQTPLADKYGMKYKKKLHNIISSLNKKYVEVYCELCKL